MRLTIAVALIETIALAAAADVARKNGTFFPLGQWSPAVGTGKGYPKTVPTNQSVPTSGPFKQYDPFANSSAHDKFRVTSLPLVQWDHDVSYAGRLPLFKDDPDERMYAFWYWPQRQFPRMYHARTLVVYILGGPGCSSLWSAIGSCGPIMWEKGDLYPKPNDWAITNMTDVLFIDSPVGTGFSTGRNLTKSHMEVASNLAAFMDVFLDTFPGLDDYKFVGFGESYGATYMAYFADLLNTRELKAGQHDIRFNKIWLLSPYMDNGESTQIGILPFMERQQSVLGLDNVDIEHLRQYSRKCGWTAFVEENYKFPGQTWKPLNTIFPETSFCSEFRINNIAYAMLASRINSADWMYNIVLEHWPTFSPSATIEDYQNKSRWVPYLDRADVKDALHMPQSVTWKLCDTTVVGGPWHHDIPTRDGTLARVIEASEIVVMSSGADDYRIPFEGVRMAIQNLTWANKTGFDSYVFEHWVSGSDAALRIYGDNFTHTGWAFPATRSGFWHEERGLRFIFLKRAGHGSVEESPVASNIIFDWLTDGMPEIEYMFDFEYDPDYWGPQPEAQLDPLPPNVKPWGIWEP